VDVLCLVAPQEGRSRAPVRTHSHRQGGSATGSASWIPVMWIARGTRPRGVADFSPLEADALDDRHFSGPSVDPRAGRAGLPAHCDRAVLSPTACRPGPTRWADAIRNSSFHVTDEASSTGSRGKPALRPLREVRGDAITPTPERVNRVEHPARPRRPSRCGSIESSSARCRWSGLMCPGLSDPTGKGFQAPPGVPAAQGR